MIIDQAVYRSGRRLPVTDLSDELALLREADDGFVWIGLKDPTEAEFDLVRDELGLHPLAVEDAVKGNQRAKIEAYGTSLFVVLKPLHYIEETSQIETGEVMLFVGPNFVVTVRRGLVAPLHEVRRRLEDNAAHLAFGPMAVLHAVLDSVVDGYTTIDREMGTDLEQMEESVFAGEMDVEARALGEVRDGGPSAPEPLTRRRESADARRIYLLKREVLEVRRAVLPLRDALASLAERPGSPVPERARPFFRDVLDHLLRVADHVESYDRLLGDILSAHLTRVSVQQNDDMRRISSWVAIAAVPTMLAGVYGMNFDHMPELHWRYGYPFALALMLGSCGLLYRMFKRSGWL